MLSSEQPPAIVGLATNYIFNSIHFVLLQCSRVGFGQVWLLLFKYKNITLQCGIIISLRHICHCRDCFLQPKKCLQKLREIKSNRWQCLFMLSFTTLRNYCFSKLMNILLNYWLLRQTRLSSSPQQLEKLPVLAFLPVFKSRRPKGFLVLVQLSSAWMS